jgi:ERCC4-related helicase
VVFATPQVIQNDLRSELLPAKRVVCLVIDEAHRATGEHAYAEAARMIHQRNKRFRMVALSATPGDSSAKVQALLFSLFISNIELRSELSSDVMQYTHAKKVDVKVIKLGPLLGGLKKRFGEKVIGPLLTKLRTFGAVYVQIYSI